VPASSNLSIKRSASSTVYTVVSADLLVAATSSGRSRRLSLILPILLVCTGLAHQDEKSGDRTVRSGLLVRDPPPLGDPLRATRPRKDTLLCFMALSPLSRGAQLPPAAAIRRFHFD